MSACCRGGPILILKTAFKNINQAENETEFEQIKLIQEPYDFCEEKYED